jgi:signal transduction histidine kinase
VTPAEEVAAGSAQVLAWAERLVTDHGSGPLGDELDRLRQCAAMVEAELSSLRARGDDWPALLKDRQVVHDLKNPLGAVLGYAELLLDDADGDLAERIEQIVAAAHSMLARLDTNAQ